MITAFFPNNCYIARMNLKRNILLALIASLTLGLAPFSPEPHIWGKLKWIAGGGDGMGLMDYWDTFMHGAPWMALILFLFLYLVRSFKKATDS
ncbi:hypothetical protein LY02_01860 [Nonlabens ulvanivorans]|uniref:RND transporter n=2 Tax=Nonlabens ulvanivorans TaxID=906888 RepID=A0ABX5E8D0_NONUL|nr:hypothetical protein LY02_01860 [Nonlabens ulvanivorans]